jgi:hypothetical protein
MYFKEPAYIFSGFKFDVVEPKIPKSTTLKSISNSLFLALPFFGDSSSFL